MFQLDQGPGILFLIIPFQPFHSFFRVLCCGEYHVWSTSTDSNFFFHVRQNTYTVIKISACMNTSLYHQLCSREQRGITKLLCDDLKASFFYVHWFTFSSSTFIFIPPLPGFHIFSSYPDVSGALLPGLSYWVSLNRLEIHYQSFQIHPDLSFLQ